MRTIDIHAHLVPQSLWRAADAGKEWHGFRHEPGEGVGVFVGGGKRHGFVSPKVRFTAAERLQDMDAQGVDVQVISIHTPFFGYHLDVREGRALAREVNDEIAAMVRQWPRRFAGLATLPIQDVNAAIAELERAVTVLGLKGAELDTVVNGENWDEPRFLDFFKADDREQVRRQLAGTLQAIICQRMVQTIHGAMTPAQEILINSGTVKKLIEENRLDKLQAAIETGTEDGMQNFNQALFALVKAGKVTEKDALAKATNPQALEMNFKGIFLDEGRRILG